MVKHIVVHSYVYVSYDLDDSKVAHCADLHTFTGRDKFGNKISLEDQTRAHWILALVTDPAKPPPYRYRFLKNRWNHPQDILAHAPRLAQFLEMCPSAKLEVREGLADVIIKTETDLVIARMTI